VHQALAAFSTLLANFCTFFRAGLDFLNENDYHLIMFTSSHSPAHSNAQSALAIHAPRFAPSPTSAALPSEKLLRGQKQIQILHNGSLYKLQTTKLGKLILTK
jgi:hemin uptake protein HemP